MHRLPRQRVEIWFMTKRSLRRLRQKDRVRARLAGDPIPDTPGERKEIEAAYEECRVKVLLTDGKETRVISDRTERFPVKSWRIIVETEEGGEWWSRPIRSALEPTVRLIEGVKSYRIEEIQT